MKIPILALVLFVSFQMNAQSTDMKKARGTFRDVISIAQQVENILFNNTESSNIDKPKFVATSHLFDIDGDGDKDLVTAVYMFKKQQFRFDYRLNNNNEFGSVSSISSTNNIYFPISAPIDILFEDIDGDKDTDMIIREYYTEDNRKETYLMENNNTTFSRAKLIETKRIILNKEYKERRQPKGFFSPTY